MNFEIEFALQLEAELMGHARPPYIDLEPLVTEGEYADLHHRLYIILRCALNAPDGLQPVVYNIANEIYLLSHEADDIENQMWMTWSFLLNVVEIIHVEDPRMSFMVDVFGSLQQLHRSRVRLYGTIESFWGDLPMLGLVAREYYDTASPRFDHADSRWISFNCFAAQLAEHRICSWTNFALWELRNALERPHSSARATESRAVTASLWLSHASFQLYLECRRGGPLWPFSREFVALAGGELFPGRPGFSMHRWYFWRERMEELSEEVDGAEVRSMINEAIDAMWWYEDEEDSIYEMGF